MPRCVDRLGDQIQQCFLIHPQRMTGAMRDLLSGRERLLTRHHEREMNRAETPDHCDGIVGPPDRP